MTSNGSGPLIETIGLKKYFKTSLGYLHAVDDINLKINQGRTLGIVGESGCGKSTLGRVILRLIEATEGKVLYRGSDILKYSLAEMREIRKKIQIIFQDPYSSLDPRMTVFQLIAEPLFINRVYKTHKEVEEKVFEIMNTVGLNARLKNTYPHELDGGRRQRIGVARALVLNPDFIVCDEPVSALDVSIQAQVLNLLMDLQENMDLTYMFITHNLSVVKHIADDIAVFYLGQCVEIASYDELFRHPVHPYTKALLSAIPVPRIRKRIEREILKGEISSAIEPPEGCRFAPRCSYVDKDVCFRAMSLEQVGQNHYVMCPVCAKGRC